MALVITTFVDEGSYLSDSLILGFMQIPVDWCGERNLISVSVTQIIKISLLYPGISVWFRTDIFNSHRVAKDAIFGQGLTVTSFLKNKNV